MIQQHNHKPYTLANNALLATINGSDNKSWNFPSEEIWAWPSRKKSFYRLSSPGSGSFMIGDTFTFTAPRKLYKIKQSINQEDFHLVWWAGIQAEMKEHPKMY